MFFVGVEETDRKFILRLRLALYAPNFAQDENSFF